MPGVRKTISSAAKIITLGRISFSVRLLRALLRALHPANPHRIGVDAQRVCDARSEALRLHEQRHQRAHVRHSRAFGESAQGARSWSSRRGSRSRPDSAPSRASGCVTANSSATRARLWLIPRPASTQTTIRSSASGSARLIAPLRRALHATVEVEARTDVAEHRQHPEQRDLVQRLQSPDDGQQPREGRKPDRERDPDAVVDRGSRGVA